DCMTEDRSRRLSARKATATTVTTESMSKVTTNATPRCVRSPGFSLTGGNRENRDMDSKSKRVLRSGACSPIDERPLLLLVPTPSENLRLLCFLLFIFCMEKSGLLRGSNRDALTEEMDLLDVIGQVVGALADFRQRPVFLIGAGFEYAQFQVQI